MDQKLLKQLYDRAEFEYGPDSKENYNLLNPERGYADEEMKRYVPPFSEYSDLSDELSAKKELDKHSVTAFGSDFDQLDNSRKIKLLLEMQRIKKEIGLPVQDTNLWMN